MFFAQCVEKQLGILLASTFEPSFLSSTPEKRDDYFDRELGRTLGELLSRLRQTTPIPEALEGRLVRALRIRNWLAHGYFWDRAAAGLTPSGRQGMVVELNEAAEFMRSVDHELTGVSEAWLIAQGLSREEIELAVHDEIESWSRRDEPK